MVQKSVARLQNINSQNILIFASLDGYGDTLVQIGEEIWSDVVGSLKVIEIALEEANDSENITIGANEMTGLIFTPQKTTSAISRIASTTTNYQTRLSSTPSQPLNGPVVSSATASDGVSITVRTTSQTTITLDNVRASSTIREIKDRIQTEHGILAALQQLEISGKQLNDELELEQSGVIEGAPVDLVLNTRKSALQSNLLTRTDSGKKLH